MADSMVELNAGTANFYGNGMERRGDGVGTGDALHTSAPALPVSL